MRNEAGHSLSKIVEYLSFKDGFSQLLVQQNCQSNGAQKADSIVSRRIL